MTLFLYFFHVLLLVDFVGERYQDVLFAVELGDLDIALREFANDIIDKPLQRFVTLWNIRVRGLYCHVFLLEVDSVTKHLNSQVLIKVCVGTLRVFGTSILRDVSCAIRFRQQVVFFLAVLAVRAVHITECALSLELRRAVFVCTCIARYLVEPFVNIEEIVHLRCRSSTFDRV